MASSIDVPARPRFPAGCRPWAGTYHLLDFLFAHILEVDDDAVSAKFGHGAVEGHYGDTRVAGRLMAPLSASGGGVDDDRVIAPGSGSAPGRCVGTSLSALVKMSMAPTTLSATAFGDDAVAVGTPAATNCRHSCSKTRSSCRWPGRARAASPRERPRRIVFSCHNPPCVVDFCNCRRFSCRRPSHPDLSTNDPGLKTVSILARAPLAGTATLTRLCKGSSTPRRRR